MCVPSWSADTFSSVWSDTLLLLCTACPPHGVICVSICERILLRIARLLADYHWLHWVHICIFHTEKKVREYSAACALLFVMSVNCRFLSILSNNWKQSRATIENTALFTSKLIQGAKNGASSPLIENPSYLFFCEKNMFHALLIWGSFYWTQTWNT